MRPIGRVTHHTRLQMIVAISEVRNFVILRLSLMADDFKGEKLNVSKQNHEE